MESGLAGILTGDNPKFIQQIPDLTGMKSEVIIQKSHRNPFDHQLRNTGAKLVVIETREELLGAIRALNEDERMRLVALAWLGRGTFEFDEWKEALATARTEHSRRTAEYLLTMPLLGDYLEDGLSMFGDGIVDDSDTREGLDRENEPLGNMKNAPRH